MAGKWERKRGKNRGKKKQGRRGEREDVDKPEKQGVAFRSWLVGDNLQGPHMYYWGLVFLFRNNWAI